MNASAPPPGATAAPADSGESGTSVPAAGTPAAGAPAAGAPAAGASSGTARTVAAPTAGERFPDTVITSLHRDGLTLTALPVQIDAGDWQTAFFYVLAPEAPGYRDGRLVPGPFAVELEADLHERPEATVVEIGLEIRADAGSFGGTLLLLTGHSAGHFETLKLMCSQDSVPLFIGDPYCRVLWRQRVPLSDAVRSGLRGLLDESVARDAVIRMSARYDPDAAFAAVLRERVIGR